MSLFPSLLFLVHLLNFICSFTYLWLSTCFLKFFISLLIHSFALASSFWTLFYWVLHYVILNCKTLVGKCSCPWIMLSFLLWYLFLLHDALLCVCGVFVVDMSFLFILLMLKLSRTLFCYGTSEFSLINISCYLKPYWPSPLNCNFWLSIVFWLSFYISLQYWSGNRV